MTHNVKVEAGESIEIRRSSYRNYELPMYVRNGIVDGKTIIDLLHEQPKPVFDMYMVLYSKRDKTTNIATLDKAVSRNAGMQQQVSVRALLKADIIRKVGKGVLIGVEGFPLLVPKRTYIVNPLLLVPVKNDDFTIALRYWRQL